MGVPLQVLCCRLRSRSKLQSSSGLLVGHERYAVYSQEGTESNHDLSFFETDIGVGSELGLFQEQGTLASLVVSQGREKRTCDYQTVFGKINECEKVFLSPTTKLRRSSGENSSNLTAYSRTLWKRIQYLHRLTSVIRETSLCKAMLGPSPTVLIAP